MIFRTLVICICLSRSFADRRQLHDDCLTGYMTNRQSWVDEFGKLTVSREKQGSSIDMSRVRNPVHEFQVRLNNMRSMQQPVKYLSFANCDLFRVPLVFKLPDHHGRPLSESLEYLTFYGNNFVTMSMPGREYDVIFNATGAVESGGNNDRSQGDVVPLVWSSGFRGADFSRLKELDLRSCSIQVLSSREFLAMTNLEALYIGENEIFFIEVDAFVGLKNLQHLDFSRNYPTDHDGNPSNLATEPLFQMLTNLVSLDLSHTVLTQRNQGMLAGLGKKLKSLSLCNTGLRNLRAGIFSKTSIEILDISRNIDILAVSNVLRGIEKTLTVLFANEIGLKNVEIFKDFKKLEILQLSNNEVVSFKSEVARQLKSLQILDLDRNRLTSWFTNTFSVMPHLRLLSLKDNNINVISEKMINDIKFIDYLAMSENFLICDCNVKEFYKKAAMNEINFNHTEVLFTPKASLFHIGYDYYNSIIYNRKTVEYDCQGEYCKDVEDSGTFRLIDNWEGSYSCLKLPDSIHVPFFDVKGCNLARDIKDYENSLNTGRLTLLILLVIPFLLLPLLIVFIFRRNLRYCCITIRNSATLSLIHNKDVVVEDGAIFNYDVFVSYCNEDRGWVLDHLLPHIESDCSISACLHERDFQVGLSILENIVSCMDRSRAIMLIISQRFLLSQWCQFEMHLAQHRLLETRREDLILVLLEDIPRRLRPNTLHYLMLTKTYIVWPKQKSERLLFWRRLNKSLLSQKNKGTESVSLA